MKRIKDTSIPGRPDPGDYVRFSGKPSELLIVIQSNAVHCRLRMNTKADPESNAHLWIRVKDLTWIGENTWEIVGSINSSRIA
jgi:hypothetical protein